MRGVETLMVAGLIGLIGVAAWQGRQWFPGLMPAPVARVTPAIQPAIAKDVRRGAKNGSRRVLGRDGRSWNASSGEDSFAPGANEPISGTTEIVVPTPGMPTSDTLIVGTTRSELQARYGAPNLGISSSRDGGLVERYYYLNPNTAKLTVATLRNGKLVSAETVQR